MSQICLRQEICFPGLWLRIVRRSLDVGLAGLTMDTRYFYVTQVSYYLVGLRRRYLP